VAEPAHDSTNKEGSEMGRGGPDGCIRSKNLFNILRPYFFYFAVVLKDLVPRDAVDKKALRKRFY
jgi:hypothetical protein